MGTDIMTIREVSEFLKINENTAYRPGTEDKLLGFSDSFAVYC